MRYTKIALLVFGCGLVLGLVVVAVEIKWLQRPASGLMAFGIAAIPIGMITDWRRAVKAAKPASTKRAKAPARRGGSLTRKSARPKRIG
jgi:hypothetical protein